MVRSCNPVVFSFYNYLRTHPLIIRRHYGQPNGTPASAGLTSERSSADEINLIERKLFFTTANAHFKVRPRGRELHGLAGQTLSVVRVLCLPSP